MKKVVYCLVIILTLCLGSQPCHAAKVKAYVNKFTISTVESKNDWKFFLQTMLMSRLNCSEIQAVDKSSDAEIQIEGSYIAFGTVFSLDALIKTSSGLFIDRVFVQGDTENEIIPAVVEMAKNIRKSILKWDPTLAPKSTDDTLAPPVEKSPATVLKKEPAQTSKPANLTTTITKRESRPESKPINAPRLYKLSEKTWVSHRLPEFLTGMAIGRSITNKGVELFITGERYLRYYLKTTNLQFLSAVSFEADEKIIGVDVADLDQNGVPEVYVSLLKDGQPVSQVYIPENNVLKKIAGNIPYLLRSIALEGNDQKVFAQKINASGNFVGEVYELLKNDDSFTTGSPLQLPLFANLHNFNQFTDSKGKQLFIVGHPEGYLLVYSKEKKQLWKSRDKFGGSEPFVCQSEKTASSPPLDTACNFTTSQRLLVTRSGSIVVSRNTGMATNGATRNYLRNSIVQFAWNGTSLQETWRTEQSQNYLADFYYDDKSKELLLLEVEPKDDSVTERGSRVVMKIVE